jgi:class 3 adenylate cyclase
MRSLNPYLQALTHVLQVRIGLHSGPVVAVVLGQQSPKLTVFGGKVASLTSLRSSFQMSSVKAAV